MGCFWVFFDMFWFGSVGLVKLVFDDVVLCLSTFLLKKEILCSELWVAWTWFLDCWGLGCERVRVRELWLFGHWFARL